MKLKESIYIYPAHKKRYSTSNFMRWTQEEEQTLMQLMDNGKLSMAKVATILKRSYSAVKEKRKNLLRQKI